MKPRIPLEQARIQDFCRRWQVVELSLFGSVLREDFRPGSDKATFVASDLLRSAILHKLTIVGA